jgi:uncharacterized protein YndB with AHSA1/START domain
MEDVQTEKDRLTIIRVFNATPEELWDLWTNPALLDQWFRPNTSEYKTKSEVDARIGGRYRIAMTHDDHTDTVVGTFKELQKPHKLIYSWHWQNEPADEVSEVSITFQPLPEGGTKLILDHDRLSGPESVKGHTEGWLGCMGNINQLLK